MIDTPGPPAFTEANRRKVDPDACACRVNDSNIVRCSLHRAAPNLLSALEVCHRALAVGGDLQRIRAQAQADVAIREAKEK